MPNPESSSSAPPSQSPSRAVWWVGLILSLLPAGMMLMGGVLNLMKPDFVVQGTIQSGYSESIVVPLGIVVLIITILYLVPRTAALGALLLTAYFGGAVATHVRLGDPIAVTLIPVVFCAVLWLGLVLRYPRLRQAIFNPTSA